MSTKTWKSWNGKWTAKQKAEMEKEKQRIKDSWPMKCCPFCGGNMGIWEIEGGWMWHGKHKSPCPIESNPSPWYGRREMCIDDWNSRPEDYIEQVAKYRQVKVRRKVGTTRRKRGQVRKAETHIR